MVHEFFEFMVAHELALVHELSEFMTVHEQLKKVSFVVQECS